jgi:endo-1,4-beta-xylanase
MKERRASIVNHIAFGTCSSGGKSMMNKLVVSGLIACAILGTTLFGPNNGNIKAAAQAGAGRAASQPATTPAASIGLKDAYAGKFLIGTACDPGNYSDAELANIKANYNVITPENCMKPQPIHPSENTYNWTTADTLMKWCEESKIKVYGHTLCWHSQTANWFFQPGADGQQATRELAMERLKNHILTVVGRYKGRIIGWDVVNEAINDGGGAGETENLRNSSWYRLIGPDYLTLAFKWAHEADPAAQLYYNDYNIEQGAVQNKGKHASSMLLLKRLIKDGAPINGVGIQGHWQLSTNLADVEKAITDYESLGLKVSISELDVTVTGNNSGAFAMGGGGGTVSTDAFQQQAQVYAKMFDIFKRHSNVISRVTFWGINDQRSWKSGQRPLLFDAQMQPKPAFQAILDVALGKN